MNHKPSPPKIATKLLEWYCHPDMLEDLQGALYEYYYERIEEGSVRKAQWMFLIDVIMHCRPHTIKSKTQNSNYMLVNHFKISIRHLWKNRLSTSLNTLGLASGLLSFMLIMLWVNLELGYDRFHKKGDRIYRVSNTFRSPSETFSQAPSGPALGGQLHKIFGDIEDATRFMSLSDRVKVGHDVFFQPDIGIVDPNFLDIFSFKWIAGDKKTALKDPHSIVLTQSTATKYFGSENPIGQSIELDQRPTRVTGVIADPQENSQIQFNALIPFNILEVWGWAWHVDPEQWGGGAFQTYLLLAKGADPEVVQADITSFIGEKLTDWAEEGMYYDYFLQPLYDIHLQSNLRYDYDSNGSQQHVTIFTSSAILILLLACINYINLATANTMKRSKEVGIRKVIGAHHMQLVNQYLVESFLVVCLAVILAIGWLIYFLPYFGALTGYVQIEIFTLEHLWFIVGLVLVLSLTAGLFPAILTSRISSLKVIKGDLKSGSHYTLLRKGLVITQFTATVVLLISMFVIQDQMSFIQNNSLGMETKGILHLNYRGISEVSEKSSVLRERLLQNPAIEKVCFLRRGYPVDGLGNSGVQVENGEGEKVTSSIYTMSVDDQFMETFGIQMASGRFYSKSHPADSVQSIVVNESCIESFGWKNAEDALGKKFGRAPNERKVIGVVKNFNFEALHKKIEPVRILPTRNNRYSSIALKTTGTDTYQLISEIQQEWEQIIPDVPFEVSFMDDDIEEQYKADYNFKSIFSAFSIISMIIGCLGLFGLATAASNQRLREIGIRKVLGASMFEIITMINKEFVALILIAVVLATPLAYYFMNEWLSNFTYHISFGWQAVLYALGGALLVTIFTISSKAIKTALTNPVNVLKDE